MTRARGTYFGLRHINVYGSRISLLFTCRRRHRRNAPQSTASRNLQFRCTQIYRDKQIVWRMQQQNESTHRVVSVLTIPSAALSHCLPDRVIYKYIVCGIRMTKIKQYTTRVFGIRVLFACDALLLACKQYAIMVVSVVFVLCFLLLSNKRQSAVNGCQGVKIR